MGGGAEEMSLGAPFSQTWPLVSQAMAFGLLPGLEGWITAVWSLISIPLLLVAMVIEFT